MSNSKLSKEAAAARNAYQREWRQKNPDKVKAALAKHWEKVAAMAKAEDREESAARKKE